MVQLQKHRAADEKCLKKESPTHHPSRTLVPSPPFILPPLRSPPLPRETLCEGSDGSPPLMLSCMNVESLQASSTHPRRGRHFKRNPRWWTYFSLPSSHGPRFLFSLFSSCPPSLGSPEVSPSTDPSYVRGRKRENTNVGFRKKIKKQMTAAPAWTSVVSLLANQTPFLFFYFCVVLEFCLHASGWKCDRCLFCCPVCASLSRRSDVPSKRPSWD